MAKKASGAATRGVVMNSPCNPTGAVYDRETLDGIVRLSERHGFALLSDEIYGSMVYDGAHHICVPAEWPSARDRIVLLNSMSKTYAMTGWRLGYVLGPAAIVAAMNKLQSQRTSNPTSIVQKAGVAALNSSQECIAEMRVDYMRLRDKMVAGLRSIPGISCLTPGGAFYAFPDISGTGLSSTEFSMRLLTSQKVAVVPGTAFGAPGEGFVRCCFATGFDKLKEAMDRMEAFVTPTPP